MKLANISSIFIFSTFVSGCAIKERFDRPDTTTEQFVADRQACVQEATQPNTIDGEKTDSSGHVRAACSVLNSCMRFHGYSIGLTGQFAASKDQAVSCAD